LGDVYVGALVEASFLLREEGNDPHIKLDVSAPKFVKVLNKSTELRQFPREHKSYVNGIVEVAIDSTAVGNFSGELTVRLGKTTANLPVSVNVKARRPGLRRILIAATPFSAFSTSDGTMFQAWTELAKDGSFDVNYLLVQRGKPILRGLDLGKFVCVFLPAAALVFATPEDVKRIRNYAEKGGWVVVAADDFYQGSVKQANAVLFGHGLQMRDERGPNNVLIGKDAIDPELVEAGVGSLHFRMASPIAVTDAKKARILVRAIGVSKEGDGFVVRAQAGKGKVIAIGQSLWWHWISKEKAQCTDNAKLLRWLLSPLERQ
jgi:hypothetical protein